MIQLIKTIRYSQDKEINGFCFYDTIGDQILSFEGEQLFESVESFIEAGKNNHYYERCMGKVGDLNL